MVSAVAYFELLSAIAAKLSELFLAENIYVKGVVGT